MKIAVAYENNVVSEHFGHCSGFMIYTVEGEEIIEENNVLNPGHTPGFLPDFLSEKDVNVVISGGMGGKAIGLFNERNIDVITGATGDIKLAAKSYLAGNLTSNGSICHEHKHSHECGNH